MRSGAGVCTAGAEDVAAVEGEPHRQKHERQRERHRGKRQQVTRLPEAPSRPKPTEGEIENASREPVVDEPDQQPGDEEPDRNHDTGPRRIVRERGRLRGDQRQRHTDEEGDRRDRVLAIVGGLPRVVAKLREHRPRRLRDEQDSLPPRAGLVRVRPVGRDAHAGSVWDGGSAIDKERFSAEKLLEPTF